MLLLLLMHAGIQVCTTSHACCARAQTQGSVSTRLALHQLSHIPSLALSFMIHRIQPANKIHGTLWLSYLLLLFCKHNIMIKWEAVPLTMWRNIVKFKSNIPQKTPLRILSIKKPLFLEILVKHINHFKFLMCFFFKFYFQITVFKFMEYVHCIYLESWMCMYIYICIFTYEYNQKKSMACLPEAHAYRAVQNCELELTASLLLMKCGFFPPWMCICYFLFLDLHANSVFFITVGDRKQNKRSISSC